MRTPITLKIKFKSSNLDQFIERYSVDVSRGGIFIRTKEPLPVGTQLRFEFQLQDASALIAGEGTVVWIREHDPARQGVAPGMGVRFDKLAAESQRVLDRILAEKQKRGDAQLESRFDAGVRANASASGTLTANRTAGHNDFGGGDSKAHTPLPGAVPGLETPGDEFGNESTRVMQNELVQSLADKTRGAEDSGVNAFLEPEPTRKASVEELKLAVQGSAVEKASELETKKEEAKVEVAAEAVKPVEQTPEPRLEAKSEEPKQEEPKVEAKKAEPKVEAEKAEPKVEAKKAEPKVEAKKAEPRVEKKPEPRRPETREEPRAAAPARKRSNAPIYAALFAVCAAGGYTLFRNRGGDEQPAPAQQEQTAATTAPAQPTAEPKMAQADTPKPTEQHQAAATATGEKPAPPATPAVEPNPAKPAKEPTAALDKPATLSVPITSDPAGAVVTVDGTPLKDPTPTTLDGLDPKKVYAVQLKLKGFHDWKVKLKPKTGDKLDAAMVPNEKVVEVATTPPGADVMLDGKRVGKTPFTIHKLDLTKAHAIEVKRAGFVAQSRSISSTDSFESKGDKDVLAVALTLAAEPKPVAPEKPAVAVAAPKPAAPKPVVHRQPPAVKKPAEKPAQAATEKPTEAEKPAVEKPAASEKPAAVAEKPVADKPAAEKPAASEEKPAAEKGGIKVPSWMQKKAPAEPSASETPSQ